MSPLVNSVQVFEEEFPVPFPVNEFDFSGGEGILLDDRYELFALIYFPSLCLVRRVIDLCCQVRVYWLEHLC